MSLKRFKPKPYVKFEHPSWTKKATIYQINTRQFTPEGTLAAAEKELPRLQELGITIVWLMPIHPIGVKNRKGTLGSPYAVQNYREVNPEFGTKEDLKRFVETAHSLGLYVILDWVANHTAWDSNLVTEHPEWYIRDWNGNFRSTPWWDWDDIIDLDFSKPELRRYMTKALKYWVKEFDIDGYRCDVAGLVPTDFWNNARKELDKIKPVFMLAEWESKDLHEHAFDMTYAWGWWSALEAVCAGHSKASDLYGYYAWNDKFWPNEAQRMVFVSNHDKNSWEGTEFERFKDGVKTAIVFSFLSEGMPLVYNGQEAGNQKRLEFFEKDPIQWQMHEHGNLIWQLIHLKKRNSALWNAPWGAKMQQVRNSQEAAIFSFVRAKKEDKVFVILNLSDQHQHVDFPDGPHKGAYAEVFSGEQITFSENTSYDIEPWGYRVFELES